MWIAGITSWDSKGDTAAHWRLTMGMFTRYVEESRRTIVRAKHHADRFGSVEIEPEHVLLALLDDPVLINRTMDGISQGRFGRPSIQSRPAFLGASRTPCPTICR